MLSKIALHWRMRERNNIKYQLTTHEFSFNTVISCWIKLVVYQQLATNKMASKYAVSHRKCAALIPTQNLTIQRLAIHSTNIYFSIETFYVKLTVQGNNMK
jgi:hypothetical protein